MGVMTYEELEACFEKHADEYLRFERVDNPRHQRPDLCAFMMLHDLVPSARDMVSAASHDEIWLDVSPEDLAPVVTDDIVCALVRCGVRWNDGCFAMFV